MTFETGKDETVEETDEWRAAKDAWGATLKHWKNKSGTRGVSYETPMAIIILAIPHRYIPIYQR